MAHLKKPLLAAAALNTGVLGVEVLAGMRSKSLSLVTDGVHNLSDEMGLLLLWLAFVLPRGVSRGAVRAANLFNSVGLIAVSFAIVFQALERMRSPSAVLGFVPVIVGLAAALGNWGVARVLKAPAEAHPAIRLAYLHNRGDIVMSFTPVVAGLLVWSTGRWILDPVIAVLVALWLIVSTMKEVVQSREDLLWPEKIACDHRDDDVPPVSAGHAETRREHPVREGRPLDEERAQTIAISR